MRVRTHASLHPNIDSQTNVPTGRGERYALFAICSNVSVGTDDRGYLSMGVAHHSTVDSGIHLSITIAMIKKYLLYH